MPFKSEAQRRLCWFLYKRDKSVGRKPKWDCKAWAKHTPKRLPYHLDKSTKPRKVKRSTRRLKKSVKRSMRRLKRSFKRSTRRLKKSIRKSRRLRH